MILTWRIFVASRRNLKVPTTKNYWLILTFNRVVMSAPWQKYWAAMQALAQYLKYTFHIVESFMYFFCENYDVMLQYLVLAMGTLLLPCPVSNLVNILIKINDQFTVSWFMHSNLNGRNVYYYFIISLIRSFTFRLILWFYFPYL